MPPTLLTTWKIKVLKNEKNVWRYYNFTLAYHKWWLYDVWFLRYGTQQNFLSFCYFALFFVLLRTNPPNNPENQNFEKMKKNACRYYHFTHVHHKWISYDVWFLRYAAWQTEFFVIFGHFLHFNPTNNSKNQNFEKIKKPLEMPSSYTSIPKIMIICYTVPEIWSVTGVIVIFHFRPFFAILPPNSLKNQN